MRPARKLGRGLGALMNLAPVEEDGSVELDNLRVAGSAPSVLQLSDQVPPEARHRSGTTSTAVAEPGVPPVVEFVAEPEPVRIPEPPEVVAVPAPEPELIHEREPERVPEPVGQRSPEPEAELTLFDDLVLDDFVIGSYLPDVEME